jgi:hypothetical protein
MQLNQGIDIMAESCKRLWAAVLEQAIEDVNRGGFYAQKARVWFQSKSEDVGSFLWVCWMLGIDPDSTKRILIESHSGILVARVEGHRSLGHSTQN